MTSPVEGDFATVERTVLDDQLAIADPKDPNEDPLTLFASEGDPTVLKEEPTVPKEEPTVPKEEPTVPSSAAAIGTPSITSTSDSWSWLAIKPELASGIIVCAFAWGLIVGVSAMWLADTLGHQEADADTRRSQQPQRESAKLEVPLLVPTQNTTAGTRVPQAVQSIVPAMPQAIQSTASATKPPARSRTARFRGVLVVNSRPSGARVFLNGQSVGTTPLVLKNQTAGSRAVRLTLDGYDSWTSAVRVVADTQTRLQAELRVQQPAQQ